jgi:hypothetical protein
MSLAKFASIALGYVFPWVPPNIFGKSLQGDAVAVSDLI